MVYYTTPIECTIERDFYKQSDEDRLKYVQEYQSEAIELLAHLIMAEAGSNYCDIMTQYYVGSVVINRAKHEKFPNTIEDVIYQSGQYPTVEYMWNMTPTSQVYEVAIDLIAFGSMLPDDVVFQANFKQGRAVYDYIDTVYFCYY